MSRCLACCQENCGYRDCGCNCHRIKPDLNPWCPECNHPLKLHSKVDKQGHKCWERMSLENNDFCGCTYGAPPQPTFSFYAIADNEDLTKANWYRTYSSSRHSGWFPKLDDAKIWTKKGQAQGKCTSLGAGVYLVEFVSGKVNVIDQQARLKEVAEKKRQEEERRRQTLAEQELADAEKALKAAQEKVNRLKKQ